MDIPAGSLASVSRQFAATTGTKLEYNSRIAQDLSLPGLHGDFSVQSGFSQIFGRHGLAVLQGRSGYFTIV
ncbi:STN domain-containing protein [Acetobacter garciniae]|uniref:STN domain-containing protein n=1 Tax=Acetobacter garciniae TaxID=2817435 RepID=A0A939HR69_9PROT|nr:STN domain-containing protein [Acetobacter garciniae]MBO1326299.1 STN domain-containing protein [Acetobacter garciniae]